MSTDPIRVLLAGSLHISGGTVMITLRRRLAALIVAGCLGWTALAHANPVTFWNEIAVQAATSGRPGPVGFLDVALVQAAVHDAVQAIEGRFEPYHFRFADEEARRQGTRVAYWTFGKFLQPLNGRDR